MKTAISAKLFKTLQRGVGLLGEEALLRVRQFVVSGMTDNGTFRDKSGKEDVYYTMFGWMLAYVLGIKTDTRKGGGYLDSLLPQEMDLIHYTAYTRCRMILSLMKKGKFRWWLSRMVKQPVRSLDTFPSIPHGDPYAPYSSFIWLSLLEDSGNRIRNKKEVLEQLREYRVRGGGYANRKDAESATVNATAAALSVRGQLEGYRPDEGVEYLLRTQDDSGGYKAADITPAPDLLSTATALFILRCYGLQPLFPPQDFIESHWLDGGGFAATLLDDTSDMEYTFYGLLALGTCS